MSRLGCWSWHLGLFRVVWPWAPGVVQSGWKLDQWVSGCPAGLLTV